MTQDPETPADDVPDVEQPEIDELIEIQVQSNMASRHLNSVRDEINQQFGETYRKLDSIDLSDKEPEYVKVVESTLEKIADVLAETGGNPNE